VLLLVPRGKSWLERVWKVSCRRWKVRKGQDFWRCIYVDSNRHVNKFISWEKSGVVLREKLHALVTRMEKLHIEQVLIERKNSL